MGKKLDLITLGIVFKQNHSENIFFTNNVFKDIIDLVYSASGIYLFLVIYFLSNLLAKMNI